MIVTDLVEKLHSDYLVPRLPVNDSLKYSFTHNGCLTDVFYTQSDEMQNQLLIAIDIENITYLSTLYFSEDNDGEYYMNYYLPPELYNNVKHSLLSGDGYSTTPYFNAMRSCIMSTAPVADSAKRNIGGRTVHKYKSHIDNPFFETIIRKPMSDDMKMKIRKKYPFHIANQIFAFCGATKTLRFTADITRAQDILTFIN